MIPVGREAINLKVNGVECAGTFFYNQVKDERVYPPILLRRESWLELVVPTDTPKKQIDYMIEWFMHSNDEIEITEDGKTYQGVVSSWEWPKKGNVSGRVELIDKWYE